MRNELLDKYHALTQYFGICEETSEKNINKIVKRALQQFVSDCKTPAIWCYGKHTRMLMTDFIYEMKGVKLIIDETHKGKENSGFLIIGQDQLRENKVDGVIISSFKYKDEIKETLEERYSDIKYLDIYDALEENGVTLANEYYASNHPYGHYTLINEYRRKIKGDVAQKGNEQLWINLVREYIQIKDFRSAALCTEKYSRYFNVESQVAEKLWELYKLQQDAVSEISDKNVVMICIDGLRRKDLFGNQENKINQMLEKSAYIFRNAYSVSTSTYESLIPAYSENADLRTKYFEKNTVDEKNCRFIQTAVEQGRRVYFYTDSISYINSDKIQVTDCAQTVTEKMWDFVLDALNEDNGLFYIHILYESHYSYPNPYTEEKIIADGSNIMFDFLARNGGCLRTDYDMQRKDAVSYIDDVLYPLLSKLKARFVLYADHGNLIFPKGTKLCDVSYAQDTFHEDLLQIPLAVKSPEMGIGANSGYISLMSINDIIISLLNKEKYVFAESDFIKIVRSEIYNPDFQYLYKKNAHERGLLAFEGFIFKTGYKLIIYADGISELYETATDQIVNDDVQKYTLLELVKNLVTVTDRLE